jgi:hypothetical protein
MSKDRYDNHNTLSQNYGGDTWELHESSTDDSDDDDEYLETTNNTVDMDDMIGTSSDDKWLESMHDENEEFK